MALAALVRVVNHVQVRDGSLPWLHRWTQSDMAFNDAWARDIAGGNVLGVPAPRPYHRWHGEVAAEAHRLVGSPEPFDEARGRGYWDRWLGGRSFYQDPVFAYALAGVYAAGGDPATALALQAVLGVLITGLVAFIACELHGPRAGLLAGAMAALYAPLIFYEGMLVRSLLQVVAVSGAVAAAVYAPRAARPALACAVCGLFAGLGVIAHATSMLFAAALGLWIAMSRPRDRRARDVAAYTGAILLALLPLMARNLAVGLPVLETSSARAVNVVTALAVDAEPRSGFHISVHTARILTEADGRLLPTLRATLATHPGVGSILAQAGAKFLAFWEAREATDNASFDYFLLHAPLLAAIGLRFALIAPLAVAGIILSCRNARAAPLYIAVGGALAVALLFFPSSRVRIPGAVMMIPFAAIGVARTITIVRERRYARLGVTAVVVAAIVLLVVTPWHGQAGDLRETDYAVGNEIAIARVRSMGEDVAGRIRIVEAQLRTQPEGLRSLEPTPGQQAVIPALDARLAGSFADLHVAGARAYGVRGDAGRASFHARRAEVLGAVARQAAGPPATRAP